jgi:predicted  nucleic acid-binding Zn-ribbon protein
LKKTNQGEERNVSPHEKDNDERRQDELMNLREEREELLERLQQLREQHERLEENVRYLRRNFPKWSGRTKDSLRLLRQE